MGLSQVALSLLSTLEKRGIIRTESWAEEGFAFRKVVTALKAGIHLETIPGSPLPLGWPVRNCGVGLSDDLLTTRRNITDPRALAIVLEQAEENLARNLHPDPYRREWSCPSAP